MRSEGVIILAVMALTVLVVGVIAYVGLHDYIEAIRESFKALRLIA